MMRRIVVASVVGGILLLLLVAGFRATRRRRPDTNERVRPSSILCPANHYNDCLEEEGDRGPLILTSNVKA